MGGLLGAVGDWVGKATGAAHEGSYFDLVTQQMASVTRTTPKTIYDPLAGSIYDVRAGYLAVNPWGAYQTGGLGVAPVIEEARTNRFSESLMDDQASLDTWTSTLTHTLNGPASIYPAAQEVTLAAGGTDDYFYQSLTMLTTPAATSFFVRLASGAAPTAADLVILHYGLLRAATITAMPGSVWYRASYAGAMTAGAGTYGIGVKANKSIIICCPQAEDGAFATSYIPTTTAAVTRNADVVTVPTTGWNAAAGTIMVVGSPAPAGGKYALWWRKDALNYIGMVSATGVLLRPSVKDGTTEYLSNCAARAVPFVGAMTWATGSPVTAYTNGVASAGSANIATTPTGLAATADIGQVVGTAQYGAPIHRATVFPATLDGAAVAVLNSLIGGALSVNPRFPVIGSGIIKGRAS